MLMWVLKCKRMESLD